MPEAAFRALVSTPVRDLPRDVLAEYTHSAHGVPARAEDLKALLPRYLDLIAQDDPPDDFAIGTVLVRFGNLRRARPGEVSGQEAEVLDRWAAAMVRARLDRDAARGEIEIGQRTAVYLMQVLIGGGWPAGAVSRAFDAAFAGEDGIKRLAAFAHGLAAERQSKWGPLAFEFYAMKEAQEARAAMEAWLGGPEFLARLEAALLDESAAPPGSEIEAALDWLYTPLVSGTRPRFG